MQIRSVFKVVEALYQVGWYSVEVSLAKGSGKNIHVFRISFELLALPILKVSCHFKWELAS